MSIATELAALAERKAAIKAAIEAKNPSVPPSDDLATWPDAIASIQGGGGVPGLDIAEVQYLEGTGTQWLNVGVAIAPGLLITSRAAIADRATVADGDVGGVPFYTYRTRGKQSGVRITDGFFKVCADSAIADAGAADTAWHDFAWNFSGLPTASVDGVVIATATAALPAAYGHTIDLFVYRTNWEFEPGTNPLAAICAGRIASFKIVDQATGDALVDLVPVRVGSGARATGYFLDRATGVLLGNQGTGAFVIGPDK